MNDLVPVKKTATFVRELEWMSDAALYKLSQPVSFHRLASEEEETTGYVIASAVVAPFSGPECLVFPANEKGEAYNMIEIGGQRGTMSHAEVLGAMGFEIQGGPPRITVDFPEEE